jgi:hypothetical protein
MTIEERGVDDLPDPAGVRPRESPVSHSTLHSKPGRRKKTEKNRSKKGEIRIDLNSNGVKSIVACVLFSCFAGHRRCRSEEETVVFFSDNISNMCSHA